MPGLALVGAAASVGRRVGSWLRPSGLVLHGWNTISTINWTNGIQSWTKTVNVTDNTGANYRIHWVTTLAEHDGNQWFWANFGAGNNNYAAYQWGSKWIGGVDGHEEFNVIGATQFSTWGVNVDDGGRGLNCYGLAELQKNFP